MKKTTTFILSLFATISMMAQSIPNNGFENWSTNTWLDLDYYGTANIQNISKYPGTSTPTTVIRTKDAYHGSYAIQMTTSIQGADTFMAYYTNSFNNPLQGKGGIPYNQMATGLRAYYKCNIKTHDSATIFVLFKKSGSVIGTYIYKLTGSKTTYTLLAETFSPALTTTPDSVIFGASPSNVLSGSERSSSMLQLDSISFTGVSSQPAMFNGDFELWHSDSAQILSGWYNFFPNTFKTTDAYAGTYALELTTVGPGATNNSPQPGVASTGDFNNSTGNITGGYPYTKQADTLSFYYKYAPTNSADSANVSIVFKVAGNPTGYSLGVNLPPATNYVHAEIPFNLPAAPDSVIIVLNSSFVNSGNIPLSYVGAVFKVDNMYFNSQKTTGTVNIAMNSNMRVYPNPVSDVLHINTQAISGNVKNISIYDMSGRLVESKNYTAGLNKTIQDFDMQNYANGMFLIMVTTNDNVYYSKFSKVSN